MAEGPGPQSWCCPAVVLGRILSPRLLEAGTSQLVGDPGPSLSGSKVEVVLGLIPTHWGMRQCLRTVAEPLVGGARSRGFWQQGLGCPELVSSKAFVAGSWKSWSWCHPLVD